MQDRARTQFLSAVVLVVVFAAGGLVGAAVVGSDSPAPEDPVALAESDEQAAESEADGNRRRQYMFERAGATEEQSEYIRSEIIPWYRGALNALEEDSTVEALDARADSARDAWRSAWRDLEAYYDPRRDALEDSARALIRDVLDPPAQLAYDSIVAQDNRRERDDDRRRP
jgi:hypothetical protein